MKKTFASAIALVLSAIMLFALCACGSAWGSIKSAYEKAGYHEVELTEATKNALHLTDEQIEDADAAVHVLTTLTEDTSIGDLLTTKVAIIWEYKNIEAVQKAYKEKLSKEEQEKFDELWKEYQKSDHVNGNCVLILGDEKIFKG